VSKRIRHILNTIRLIFSAAASICQLLKILTGKLIVRSDGAASRLWITSTTPASASSAAASEDSTQYCSEDIDLSAGISWTWTKNRNVTRSVVLDRIDQSVKFLCVINVI